MTFRHWRSLFALLLPLALFLASTPATEPDPFGRDEVPIIDNPFALPDDDDPFGESGELLAGDAPFGVVEALDTSDDQPAQASAEPALPQFTFAPRRDQTDADIEAALAKPANLDFLDTPLPHVIDLLRERYQINIDVDQLAFKDAGLVPGIEFTTAVRTAHLESALEILLHQHGLTFYVADGALVITMPDYVYRSASTKVYPIHDLIIPLDPEADYPPDPDGLIGALESTINPTSWEIRGGHGCLIPLEKVLVVHQSWRTHRKIRQFLDAARQTRKVLVANHAGPPEVAYVPVETEHAEILKALGGKTEIEVIEVALQDVVDLFKNRHGINIEIDTRAMADVGIGSDTAVTRELRDISLRSALRLILSELDLTMMIQDDVLVITTPEEVESQLQTRFYPVLDLVSPPEEAATEELIDLNYGPRGRHDYDSLIEIITGLLAPTMWEEVGGPGPIEVVEGALVVSQTRWVHDEITGLLGTLRKLKAAAVKRPLKKPLMLQGSRFTDNENALAALEQKLGKVPPLIETALQDVVDLLKDLSDVEIQIDAKALEDVGLGSDTPITATIGHEPLRVALKRILRPLDLTFAVRSEVILITTPEEAENELVVKVYDTVGLSGYEPETGLTSPWFHPDDLADAISNTISSRDWEAVGGPGAIEYDWNSGGLVVAQTEEVHRGVQELLAKIRAVNQTLHQVGPQPPTKFETAHAGVIESDVKRDKSGEKVYLKIYRLDASPNDARDLEVMVRDLIAPKSWAADEAYYAKALSTALVVRHTAATHRKIHRLLTQLEMLDGFGVDGRLLPIQGWNGVAPLPGGHVDPTLGTKRTSIKR